MEDSTRTRADGVKGKVRRWVVVVGLLVVVYLIVHLVYIRRWVPAISGAVVRQDTDLRKQVPIADVEISAADGLSAGDCTSDASGFFRLPLRAGVTRGETVTLLFQHPGYKPLELNEIAGDRIYVARMAPVSQEAGGAAEHPDVVITNVEVRYSMKSTAVVNVGSVVKTFQAVNTGNVPCHGRKPCSPDGKWKAALGSLSLDAGPGAEFRDARVSCIAGPCPFTRTDPPQFSQDGRDVKVSALDWSDSATFLLEAEVDRPTVSDTGRKSFPVTFGGSLTFALPVGAEGVIIEAEMNGTPIVFPLGPDVILDWADCNAKLNRDRTKTYRCALKPGYRFQD